MHMIVTDQEIKASRQRSTEGVRTLGDLYWVTEPLPGDLLFNYVRLEWSQFSRA